VTPDPKNPSRVKEDEDVHPFDRSKLRLTRRVREARLRVNLEPLGVSLGRRQASPSDWGVERFSPRILVIDDEMIVCESC
jgi:hypothetical protein